MKSGFPRHTLIATALLGLIAAGAAQAASDPDVVRIGFITDMSGPYADTDGPGGLEAIRMAVQDAGGTVLGKKIEILSADHQNKPEIASARAREWIDQQGLSMLIGGVNSAVKLAHTVRSLKDGVTVDKLNSLAKETVGVIRGADGAVKLWKKGKDIATLASGAGKVGKFIGGKLNPVLAVTSAATTLVESRKNIQNWSKISTAQKVKTVADTVGAVADVVGVVFPPAKAVSAGLALVSMGVDWFSKK